MKKIEYIAPEMEIVNLQVMSSLLAGSVDLGEDDVYGGEGDPGLGLD